MAEAAKVARDNVRLGDLESLKEMLVAAVTLSMQIGEADVADHLLEALRALHRDEGASSGEGNVGSC